MTNYQRTPEELKKHAVLYWPKDLAEKERAASIIPMLLSTQDKFISVLDVSDSAPDSWMHALAATAEMPANLFLKHLMVLSDIGGEKLDRFNSDIHNIFSQKQMKYIWKGRTYIYQFEVICDRRIRWLTKKFFVDNKGIKSAHDLNPLMKDTIMLILHGASSVESIPDDIKELCIIGSLMGEKEKLEKFVKERYIFVSRQTAGAKSNRLGQLAQDYVKDILDRKLLGWKIIRNGSIPGMSQNAGDTDMSFDIVAKSPKGNWAGIEVGFQFTTNSVIERKAGQAEARAKLLHSANHRIAYVIDGAGNFQRASALTTICKNSDCTVTFAPEEMDHLIDFLQIEP